MARKYARSAARVCAAVVLAAMLCSARPAAADDWPNFLGPRHDGISRETGLARSWPADGPHVIWRRDVGAGFSSFAVVGGRVFTCGTHDNQQAVICLDFNRGDVLWRQPIEPQFTDPDANLHGPRATPTVDEGRVYMQGGHARLVCLDAADGRVIWERQFTNKPHWGYSASVLIIGERAIVCAGGADGALCALDKRSGAVLWKCGDDPAAYATPRAFELGGRRYVCGVMGQSVIAADIETGREALRFEWPSHSGVNAATPIAHEGHLLISTGYGYGAGLFRLAAEGERLKAEPVWKSTKLRNKFQTPILHEGRLYTCDEDALKCVEFATGKRLWRKSGQHHGGLTMADGMLILLTETGELQMAAPSPEGFQPLATAKLFAGTSYNLLLRKQGARCWTAPVVSGGRLLARDHDTVVCLELRAAVGGATGTNTP